MGEDNSIVCGLLADGVDCGICCCGIGAGFGGLGGAVAIGSGGLVAVSLLLDLDTDCLGPK